MAGDFSRNTFDPVRHFSGVLMQQGRVLVDAEWNEQLAIQQHRAHTETRDVIGNCGTPKKEDGFKISQTPHGNDLLISAGRYYVQGLLCEQEGTPLTVTIPASPNNQVLVPYFSLDEVTFDLGQWVHLTSENNSAPLVTQITAVDAAKLTLTLDTDISAYRNTGAVSLQRNLSYTTQPGYPTPDFVSASPPNPPGINQIQLADGNYLVFLEAWQREVDVLEDPRLREVALGGPDTTERLQTIWQVRLLPVKQLASPPASPLSSPLSSPPDGVHPCCSDFPEWKKLTAPTTGTMNARTVPPSGNTNPCVLPPTAGYQSLENQLYRIEVFKGGDSLSQTTFVWSRDNAMLETTITKVDGNDIFVTDFGKDDNIFSFAAGQVIEIVYQGSELSGAPRFLAQISGTPNRSTLKITLNTSAAALAEIPNLRLRRWDMTGASVTSTGIVMKTGWMDIENGIQVQFSEGSYRSGDYWQVPARTATGEIEWPPFDVPNKNPIPQPPLGIRRHFCCLAQIVVTGAVWTIKDCREKFPSLTHICADDVCYEGTCDLPGITTVQDAIDQLCKQRDLRFHNKHLHGWGIVCGLQVNCGPDSTTPRSHITVRSGYAITCDGVDVVLNKDQVLDILTMVKQLPSPPSSPPSSPPGLPFPNGDYSLILDPGGNFQVQPYVPPQSVWDDILNDTLLLDIYDDCIKPLLDFFKGQLETSPPQGNDPVGLGQKRLTALMNLLIQYSNPDSGSFVFLSGDQKNPDPEQEDVILHTFYNDLRKLLQSATFCGMFEKARPFPQYPYTQTNINTIFGKDFKTRLRVEPGGRRAYTVGVNQIIHVYDLQANKLVTEAAFPDSTAVVRDIAFSANGAQAFVIATIDQQHTMFSVANVSGNTLQFQKNVLIPNVALLTLATVTGVSGIVFAVGQGRGLYRIDPATFSATIAASLAPVFAFPAFGHLVADDRSGFAVATAQRVGSPMPSPDHFDSVFLFNLNQPQDPLASSLAQLGLQGNIDDDVAITPAANVEQMKICVSAVIASAPANRKLAVLNFGDFATGKAAAVTDLEQNSPVRLAFNQTTNFLMITFEQSYQLRLFELSQNFLEPVRYPVQIQPISIAMHAKNATVYVLNYTSNTITTYPADFLIPSKQLNLQQLVDYRSAMIEAFLDLFGGFTEYLKDCICDHLLVNCPSCDADDQLFLGTVSIRDGQVFKICNFSKRKYVKSFPTIGYWLSFIPIGPIIGKLVEKFCCTALPSIFGNQKAPRPSQQAMNNPSAAISTNTIITPDVIRGGITFLQQTSFTGAALSALTRLIPSGNIFTDFFTAKGQTQVQVAQPVQVGAHEVVGLPVSQATQKFAASNILVANVLPYDPQALGTNLVRSVSAPTAVKAGSAVSLVVDKQGNVTGFVPSSADVSALHADLRQSQQQVAENTAAVQKVLTLSQQLQDTVSSTQKTLTESQPALNAALALQNQVTDLNTQLSAQSDQLKAGQQQIAQANTAVSQLTTQNQQLQQALNDTRKTLADNQAAVNAAKTLQDQVKTLTDQLNSQQAAHDTQIANLQTQLKTVEDLRTQIQKISARLPGTGGAGGQG